MCANFHNILIIALLINKNYNKYEICLFFLHNGENLLIRKEYKT